MFMIYHFFPDISVKSYNASSSLIIGMINADNNNHVEGVQSYVTIMCSLAQDELLKKIADFDNVIYILFRS